DRPALHGLEADGVKLHVRVRQQGQAAVDSRPVIGEGPAPGLLAHFHCRILAADPFGAAASQLAFAVHVEQPELEGGAADVGYQYDHPLLTAMTNVEIRMTNP